MEQLEQGFFEKSRWKVVMDWLTGSLLESQFFFDFKPQEEKICHNLNITPFPTFNFSRAF